MSCPEILPDLEALLVAAAAASGATEKDALIADALAICSASRSGRSDVAQNISSAPPEPPPEPPAGWVGLVSYRCTGCGSTQLGHAGHEGQVSVCCGVGTYELVLEVSA